MKRVGAGMVAVIAAAMALSLLHPFGNPRVEPAKGLDTLLRDAKMPAAAKGVLVSKCADCHSNETRWPVYARIAPGAWLIERDIVEARRKMNLSKWDELSTDRQDVLIAKMIHETKDGEMPPKQYLALHWKARLTEGDIAAIASMGKAGVVEAGGGGTGDAVRGKAVFERRCTGCHALEVDREGPRLRGVYGRRAGSVAGFSYSAGLKGAQMVWDDAALEKWLTDPDLVVPQNAMSISVPKAADRRDLVAYLKGMR